MQFKRGLRLLKGVVCLLFLSNVPGAMFIQGCTFIPDSRVMELILWPVLANWNHCAPPPRLTDRACQTYLHQGTTTNMYTAALVPMPL